MGGSKRNEKKNISVLVIEWMFSWCRPSSALVLGVYRGLSSLLQFCRFAGRVMPHTVPLDWYSCVVVGTCVVWES